MNFLVVVLTFALAATIIAQPAPTASIMESLLRARQDWTSTIIQAIQVAGLADTLQKGINQILKYFYDSIVKSIYAKLYDNKCYYTDGPFILFAPTNDAFKALPDGALAKLVAAPADLKKVLSRHVVRTSGRIGDPQVPLKAGDLTNLDGTVLKVVMSASGKTNLQFYELFFIIYK